MKYIIAFLIAIAASTSACARQADFASDNLMRVYFFAWASGEKAIDFSSVVQDLQVGIPVENIADDSLNNITMRQKYEGKWVRILGYVGDANYQKNAINLKIGTDPIYFDAYLASKYKFINDLKVNDFVDLLCYSPNSDGVQILATKCQPYLDAAWAMHGKEILENRNEILANSTGGKALVLDYLAAKANKPQFAKQCGTESFYSFNKGMCIDFLKNIASPFAKKLGERIKAACASDQDSASCRASKEDFRSTFKEFGMDI